MSRYNSVVFWYSFLLLPQAIISVLLLILLLFIALLLFFYQFFWEQGFIGFTSNLFLFVNWTPFSWIFGRGAYFFYFLFFIILNIRRDMQDSVILMFGTKFLWYAFQLNYPEWLRIVKKIYIFVVLTYIYEVLLDFFEKCPLKFCHWL